MFRLRMSGEQRFGLRCLARAGTNARLLALAGAVLLPAHAAAQPSVRPDFSTWVKEHIAAGQEYREKGYEGTARYGNWVGEGWWGGSTSPTAPGMNPPVDDLDAVAQRHDFGYQIAEELGRGRPGVTGTYLLMADIIAIRDALALDRDPAKWAHPPKDIERAKTFVKRLVIIFEEFQTRRNALKSMEMGRADVGDLDTLDRMLDGLPAQADFERMQTERVRKWEASYRAYMVTRPPVPVPASAAPKPPPAGTKTPDCSQGSFMDRTLCAHDPNAKPKQP